MEEILKSISIRGRFAFCMACLRNAMQQEGIPMSKLQQVFDRLNSFLTTTKLDEWEQYVVEISPDTIFDEHPDNDFDDYKTLNRTDLEKMKDIYLTLPKNIVELLDLIVSVGISNLYGGTGEYSEHTLKPAMLVIELMRKAGYKMPDISLYQQYSFQENNGWGNAQNYSVA